MYALKGIRCGIGCEQSFLLRMLNMLAFIIVIVIPSIRADCAAIHPCYCNANNLHCWNIGNITNIPQFNPSNRTYNILRISKIPTLTTVQNYAFSGLKVKIIILSELGLTTVEPRAFSGLGDTCEKLTVVKTPLESLPDGVFDDVSHSLRQLYLGQNQISALSHGLFSKLTRLETLSVRYNQLDVIPEDVFSTLTELIFLHLQHNTLATLSPVMFRQLTNLQHLLLGNNQLNTLNSAIFDNLTQLKTLDISYNKLENFPDGVFSELKNLESLNIRNCSLKTINPSLFSSLTHLKYIYLDKNQLKTIPDNTFSKLVNLWYLGLQTNPMGILNPALLSHLTNLHELDISDIQLKTVNPNLFNNLTHLERLNLNNNQLEVIPYNTFSQLKELRHLKLKNNMLTTLVSNIFSHLTKLYFFQIENNPFTCDCNLAWLRNFTRWDFPFEENNPVCFNPPEVKNISVLSYDIPACSSLTNSTATTMEVTYMTTVSSWQGNVRNTRTTLTNDVTEGAQSTSKPNDVNNQAFQKKYNTEHIALIVVGILCGLLLTALIVCMIIIIRRHQCGKCWEDGVKEDHYAEPHHTDMDLHTYDSLAGPESVPNYENMISTNNN